MEEGASVRDAISSLLLRAWRERATETEYATRIRRVLPRGVCGDVYDLSESILSQALVGPTINERLLAYLGHSASAAIVTYGDVLAAIAATSDSVQNKPLALIALLEFVHSKIFPTISCSGNEEECIRLAHSIQEIVLWLQNCILVAVSRLPGGGAGGSGPGPGVIGAGGMGTGLGGAGNSSGGLGGSGGLNSGGGVVFSCEWTQTIDLSAKIMSTIATDSFYKSLLYVGKTDNEERFATLLDLQGQLEFKLQTISFNNLISSGVWPTGRESVDSILNFLSKIEWLQADMVDVVSSQIIPAFEEHMMTSRCEKGFMSLSSIVAFGAVLHPASSVDIIVAQISTLHSLQAIPLSDLIRDLIRLCLMGVVDPLHTDDHKWAAFTFLKLPLILVKLIERHNAQQKLEQQNSMDTNQTNGSLTTPSPLEVALNEVLDFPLFLNTIDSKSNCESIEYLNNELCKKGVLSQEARERVSARRKEQMARLEGTKSSADGTPTSSTPTTPTGPTTTNPGARPLMLRAEPTVTSILNTLDVDYSNQQPHLLRVLCGMLSGKSLDLILSAAAASGRLGSFITKLIRFNEFNKDPPAETTGNKSGHTRALLFEITFLMVTYIAQQYGSEIVLSNCLAAGLESSWIAIWCSECLPESGHRVRPDRILSLCDSAKVDKLIDIFTANTGLDTPIDKSESEPSEAESTAGDVMSGDARWQEVCQNTPGAIKEILVAWECDAITSQVVKQILDNVKRRMSSIPVVASAYLISYLPLLHHEERLKPMNLLQELMKPMPEPAPAPPAAPPTPVAAAPAEGADAPPAAPVPPPVVSEPSYHKERSQLMAQVIKRMLYEHSPPTNNSSTQNNQSAASNGTSGAKATPPKTSNSSAITTALHGITSTLPLWHLFEDSFNEIRSKSSIDMKVTYQLNSLYNVGGPEWYVDALVRMLLMTDKSLVAQRCISAAETQELPGQLFQKFSLVYGLFHMNMEKCSQALLLHVLPKMLITCGSQPTHSVDHFGSHYDEEQLNLTTRLTRQNLELTDPRATLLARLTVMVIYAAWSEREARRSTTEGSVHSAAALRKKSANGTASLSAGCVKRRVSLTLDLEHDLIMKKIKTEFDENKLLDETPFSFVAEQQRRQAANHDDDEDESMETDAKSESHLSDKTFGRESPFDDPLCAAVADLLKLMTYLVANSALNEQTNFVKSFLEQLLLLSRSGATRVLQFLPVSLIAQLIKLYPQSSAEFVIALSDTRTARARRTTAQNVCQLARLRRTVALQDAFPPHHNGANHDAFNQLITQPNGT